MIWNNSKMQVLYFDKTVADDNWPCVVRLSDTEIVVEYEDGETVTHRGKNDGSGHYQLDAGDGSKATLHGIPDSTVLEGSWLEDRERGMWRIDLEE